MTISTTTSSISYNGNGVTTIFAVPFRFFANTDLVVQRITVSTGATSTLTLTTHYTVTGADEEAGGSLTMLTAPAVGQRLVIRRVIPATQEVDYVAGDPFPAETHERALDRLTMLAQQTSESQSRAVTLPATSVGVSTELPSASPASLIGWDATGLSLQNYDASSLGIAIAFSSWRTDVFNGTGAQTAFVLSEDPFTASNCDVSVGGVTQIAGVNFSYTVATRTITFLTGAPVAGTGNVAVRYGQAAPLGVPSDLSVSTGKIADDAVTFPKLQNIASASILGRSTAGTGDVEALTGAQARDLVGGLPAGAVAHFAMNSPPTGWLRANGAAVSRTTFAALFAAIGTTFGAGDGSTTFNLPDLRGEFIRGFDDGRGVDTGRVFGSAQGDAIRNITGALSFRQSGPAGVSGAFTGSGTTAFDGGSSYTGILNVNFNASSSVPTASENRPRNIALLACIKF